MHHRWILMAGIALSLAGGAAAQQLHIRLRAETDVFLLYEPVFIEVSIQNNTGTAIELRGAEGKSWLRFLITDSSQRAVDELKPLVEEPLLIGARQTVRRTVNLLPAYDLRERGNYQVQALVDGGGVRGSSMPLKFAILQGNEIWTQTIGVGGAGPADQQFRTYSLVIKHERQYDVAYAGVRDEQAGRVYGMLRLGRYVAVGKPEVQVDKDGFVHYLWRTAPRLFGYVVLDPMASVVEQAVYSDLTSMPRLVADAAGAVAVRGGEKQSPRPAHVLTEEELNPPAPAPAAPPPKKKWWWPFGGGKKKPATAPVTP